MIRGLKYLAALPPGGYAEAAKRAILGLSAAGVPVTFQPLVEGSSWGMNLEPYGGTAIADPELAPWCNRPIDYDTVIVHAPPELFPAVRAAEPGKRLIGMTVWETDRLLPQWLPWLDAADQLVVPCAWNRTVFLACGVRRPVAVVPHIAIPNGTDALDRDPSLRDRCVFYSVGTWSGRKNLAALVRAYLTAFTRDDPAVLILKTGRRNLTRRRPWIWPRTTQGAINLLRRRYPAPAEIRLVTEVWTEAQMAALHRQGDCYAALPHAEGWGLGSFDAAAAGKPVIATGYGGPLEYLGADYPLLVRHNVGPARGQGFERALFRSDQNWAMPDEADAARKLRWVLERRNEASALGRGLRERILRNYSSEVLTAELLRVVAAA